MAAKLVFNPFTANFDFVAASSTGGPGGEGEKPGVNSINVVAPLTKSGLNTDPIIGLDLRSYKLHKGKPNYYLMTSCSYRGSTFIQIQCWGSSFPIEDEVQHPGSERPPDVARLENEGQFLQYNSSNTFGSQSWTCPTPWNSRVLDATVGSSALRHLSQATSGSTTAPAMSMLHGPALTAQPWSAVNSSSTTPIPVGRYWSPEPIGVTPTVQNGIRKPLATCQHKIIELDEAWLNARYAAEDHDHNNASSTEDGFMSSQDKIKLDAATSPKRVTPALRDALGASPSTRSLLTSTTSTTCPPGAPS